jgi:hypothetical protein
MKHEWGVRQMHYLKWAVRDVGHVRNCVLLCAIVCYLVLAVLAHAFDLL